MARCRYCVKTGGPCYENLRFNFGDGEAVNFERLLVPYSEDGTSFRTHPPVRTQNERDILLLSSAPAWRQIFP